MTELQCDRCKFAEFMKSYEEKENIRMVKELIECDGERIGIVIGRCMFAKQRVYLNPIKYNYHILIINKGIQIEGDVMDIKEDGETLRLWKRIRENRHFWERKSKGDYLSMVAEIKINHKDEGEEE